MGPRQCPAEVAAQAEEVGTGIARAGAILVCGGGRGVMEAAARGAASAGGIVVGILPSEDAAWASPWVTIPIVTGMGNARNVINVLTSHSVIAVSGGPGTLSEIALAFKTGTPVVGLDSWQPRLAGGIPAGCTIHPARDALDAVRQALALGAERMETRPEGNGEPDSSLPETRLY